MKRKPIIVLDSIQTMVVSLYNSGMSTYQVCEQLGPDFYPNKVNRILRKAGIKPRDKSKAQKLNLKSGRTTHPTAGKKRSEKTKKLISEGISKTYRSDPTNKEKRSALSRELWAAKSEAEKANLSHKAAQGVRQASVDGSKAEKFLAKEIGKLGYLVEIHPRLLYNSNLEVDLFLRELNLCIECDGKTHYESVFGEEALQRTQKSDAEKNGLILAKYNLIRLQAFSKKFTAAYGRRTFNRLMTGGLQKIIDNHGNLLPIEDRFILIKEEI